MEDLSYQKETTLELLCTRASEVKSHFPSAKRWLDRLVILGENNIAALQAIEYANDTKDEIKLSAQYLDLAVDYDPSVREEADKVRLYLR